VGGSGDPEVNFSATLAARKHDTGSVRRGMKRIYMLAERPGLNQ